MSSESFYKDVNSKDGFNSYCKECRRKVNRKYNKKQYKKNPLKNHKQNIKRLYGITYEEYLDLEKKQNYRCAICGLTLEEAKSRYGRGKVKHFHIDHDHKIGKVRGLLCQRCNWGLGNFKHDLNNLKKATKYLERFNLKFHEVMFKR